MGVVTPETLLHIVLYSKSPALGAFEGIYSQESLLWVQWGGGEVKEVQPVQVLPPVEIIR